MTYMDEIENSFPNWLDDINDEYMFSAQNLLQYLALRSIDIREIQSELISYGISSMGTSAGYVHENISRSLGLLRLIRGKTIDGDLNNPGSGFKDSNELLDSRSTSLFRTNGSGTGAKIMVTLPDEVVDNTTMMIQFIGAGMDLARINLSHGDYNLWDRMLDRIIGAGNSLSHDVTVFMDLPGPKIRVENIFITNGNADGYDQVGSVSLLKEECLELMKETDSHRLQDPGRFENKVVTVMLPQILDDLKVGHPIFFDDGAIEGKVISKSSMGAVIEIVKVTKKKLRTGKGINLPDTHLSLPSLTDNDIELLPYACKNADIIGYSFVRTPGDVQLLYAKLSNLGDKDTGVVFKIETREAFENLPGILVEAMKRRKIGVMIARGDLAVEVGFERISEVKDQIMSICEAAHIPVIWATQVLENMAKKGLATRAEISDVVLSGKAECVMLNKGPYMTDTIGVLKNILARMAEHYDKNKSTLRALEVAKNSIRSMQNDRSI